MPADVLGVRRAGRWPKLQARRQRLDALRSHPWVLSRIAAGYAVLTALVVALSRPFRGFVAGAATASFFWIVWVLVDSPSSESKSLGGEAEIWTSNGLRRLRRAGWTVIDHVPFEERNVDHVLVGPSGVIAVESKYSSGPWQIVGDELRGPVGDPIGQAREGARKIRLLLQSELIGVRVPVAAALAVWGPAQRQMKGGRAVRGVWLLVGSESQEWARQIPARPDELSPEAVEEILQGLRSFIRLREEAAGRAPAA